MSDLARDKLERTVIALLKRADYVPATDTAYVALLTELVLAVGRVADEINTLAGVQAKAADDLNYRLAQIERQLLVSQGA
jgi:hypothetical protein